MRTKNLKEALEKVKEYDETAYSVIDAYITHLERTNFGLRTTVANFREQQEKRLKGYTIRNRSRWK